MPLMDKDQVRILSERTYYDGACLSISGEVRMAWKCLTILPLLRRSTKLAGGLTFAGDSARIDCLPYRI